MEDAIIRVLEAESAYLQALVDMLGDLPGGLDMRAFNRYRNVTFRVLEIPEKELRERPEFLRERYDNVQAALQEYKEMLKK